MDLLHPNSTISTAYTGTFSMKNAIKLLLPIGLFSVSLLIGCFISDNYWKQLLLKKGYAEYDRKNGNWYMCEPQVVLLNTNEQALHTLEGGTVTINNYLKVLEEQIKNMEALNEIHLKELAEQDLLLEKYKKNIKLPPEPPKQTVAK